MKRSKQCSDCGSCFYTKSWNYEGDASVWECNCCGTETPRQVRRKGSDFTTPNARQLQYLRRFKIAAIKFHGSDLFPQYVKDEAWFLTGGKLGCTFTLATPADEGTALSLYRPHYHVYIGRKGGWEAYNKDGHKVQGWKAVYAYRS